jgi:hypothetical protein
MASDSPAAAAPPLLILQLVNLVMLTGVAVATRTVGRGPVQPTTRMFRGALSCVKLAAPSGRMPAYSSAYSITRQQGVTLPTLS